MPSLITECKIKERRHHSKQTQLTVISRPVPPSARQNKTRRHPETGRILLMMLQHRQEHGPTAQGRQLQTPAYQSESVIGLRAAHVYQSFTSESSPPSGFPPPLLPHHSVSGAIRLSYSGEPLTLPQRTRFLAMSYLRCHEVVEVQLVLGRTDLLGVGPPPVGRLVNTIYL
jgi:hypothetical protein